MNARKLILATIVFIFTLTGCQDKYTMDKDFANRDQMNIHANLKLTSEVLRTKVDVDSITNTYIGTIEGIQNWIITKIMESSDNAFNLYLTRLVVENMALYGPTLEYELHNAVLLDDKLKHKYSIDSNDWLKIYLKDSYPVLCLTKLEILKLDLVLASL